MIRKPTHDQTVEILKDLDALIEVTPPGAPLEIVTRARAIINDYGNHTIRPSRVIRKSGAFLCPACGKRTKPTHSYCHVCGKRLWWD